jgi:hypothetical protein
MRLILVLCLFVVTLGLSGVISQTLPTAQSLPTQATVNVPNQFRLISVKKYARPIVDVRIRATFTHRPSGQSRTIAGYWAGDSAYDVRFAPTLGGVWEYRITASDSSNRALHGITGAFVATVQASNNPLVKNGFLKIAPNRRTLAHADGTPFFWLGDTAWEMLVRGKKDEMLRLLDDRARKGFTALQTTHAMLVEDDSRDFNGTLLYLNNDRTLLNPRFFDGLDSLMTWANERGIVVALVPQWANGGVEGYDRGWVRKPITQAEALIAAEYLGARYAAHHVVWVVGGDVRYDTPERRLYWERFAGVLREADGGQQLMSIHPEGLTASYDFFSNTASWLDFHMLQSSHQPWTNDRTALVRRGYDRLPTKPVLNAEPPYEDFILNSFFSDFEASFIGGKYRAKPYDVRLAAYMSIFNGGLVGVTYGANGIFQWNSEANPNPIHQPRLTVDSALSLPGSAQMGILKRLLTDVHWEEMIPRLDLVTTIAAERGVTPFYGALASSETFIGYFGEGLRSVTLSCGALRGDGAFVVRWISPTTGETVSSLMPFSLSPITLRPPALSEDWLVTVRRSVSFSGSPSPTTNVDTTALKLTRLRPDKGNSVVEIAFNVPDAGALDVHVYDVLGNAILNQRLQVGRGEAYFVLPIPASGAYFYRAAFEGDRFTSQISGKFIQL